MIPPRPLTALARRENPHEHFLSSLSSESSQSSNCFTWVSQMSSQPGHLNEEKNLLVRQGSTLRPPSRHLLPPRERNTDVSLRRLLGMNVGYSNELICLQDMLICKAGCNHAYDLTVWRFHPESSRNTNRVKTSAAKAKQHRHGAGVTRGGCLSHQRPSLPVTG